MQVDLMPYADDSIWLLFGLGLAMVGGVAVAYFVFGIWGYASLGFLIAGIMVSASYYTVGTHPPIGAKRESGDVQPRRRRKASTEEGVSN